MFKFAGLGAVLLASILGSSSAWAAADCSVQIAGTDQMTFDLSEITVDKSCKTFTVNLVHPGVLPKNVMGHNWVLIKREDLQGVATDGIAAGIGNDYLKPGDARVIAHTRLIGGGEKDSVTFDVATLNPDDDYLFFCSFPGHPAIMQGTLSLQ